METALAKEKIIGILISAALGMLIGVALVVILFNWFPQYAKMILPESDLTIESVEVTETPKSNVTAQIKEIVLGSSAQKKQLIVYTRDVYSTTSFKQSGFVDWGIFRKTQEIVYKGTAEYTVDLSKVNEKSIVVNHDDKTVTVYIPHSQLLNDNIIVNSEDIKFKDTEKGLLAFGDLEATPEQIAKIETTVKDEMKTKLAEENEYKNAERFAVLSTWEILQPSIATVAPGYNLKIEFRK